jgi:hypothetical protein
VSRLVWSTYSGYIYILTNPAFPGLVKIGHTGRTPQIRAAELSAATGLPAPFTVAWSHQVTDHAALEAIVHARLGNCRPNGSREFFRCSVNEARRAIEREAAALLLPWWRIILHRLVHPLPRQRPTYQPWRRRKPQDDLFGFYSLIAGVIFAGLIITLRPVMPSWLPPSVISAAYALERLHP